MSSQTSLIPSGWLREGIKMIRPHLVSKFFNASRSVLETNFSFSRTFNCMLLLCHQPNVLLEGLEPIRFTAHTINSPQKELCSKQSIASRTWGQSHSFNVPSRYITHRSMDTFSIEPVMAA